MPWAESVPFVSSGLPAGHLQGLLGPQAMATGYLGPSRNEPHGCGRQTAHLCLQTHRHSSDRRIVPGAQSSPGSGRGMSGILTTCPGTQELMAC